MQGCLMVLSIRDQLAMLQMEFRETCLLEKMWIMLKRGWGELSTNIKAKDLNWWLGYNPKNIGDP